MEFPRDNRMSGRGGGGPTTPISGVYFADQQQARMLTPVIIVDRNTGAMTRVQVPAVSVPSPTVQLIDVKSLAGLNGVPGVTLVPVPLPQQMSHPTLSGLVPQNCIGTGPPAYGLVSKRTTMQLAQSRFLSQGATTTVQGPSISLLSHRTKIQAPPCRLVSQYPALQQGPCRSLFTPINTEPPSSPPDEDCEEICIRMGSGLGASAYKDLGTFPPRPVSIMRYANSNVDPVNWSKCKMIRDIKRSNPMKTGHFTEGISKPLEPETGGGSTYGAKDLLEFKKRNKLRKYKQKPIQRQTQPWLIKLSEVGGESREMKTKCFKGTKEGGISEHTSYFILIEQKTEEEKVFEAYPVDNWFDFKLINSYRNLTVDEAEDKFRKRNETYNFFSLMTKKRLNKGAGDTSSDEESNPLQSAKKKSKLGNKTENGGGKYPLSNWTDSSSDDEGKVGGFNKKRRGKDVGLISSGFDGEDNEAEVGFMSSSEFSSSDDGDDAAEPGTKPNAIDLLNSSSQSEFGEGSSQQSV